MDYIGSKKTLLPFIYKVIKDTYDGDLEQSIFCDIFSGTGVVAGFYKNKVKRVIANDQQYYSYILLRNYIGNKGIFEIPFNPTKKVGFITKTYSPYNNNERMYFTEENAQYIDGIREQIEEYNNDEDLYYFLLCSLLESLDKISNTASVYGAFLKKFKKSALKTLDYIDYQPYEGNKGLVFNEDANDLITEIKGDILYLDPPYNNRQYGSNYHILNTVAKNDIFNPTTKTGLPKYEKSLYCSKALIKEVFNDLIDNADFNHIYISYNNEGILSYNDFIDILESYGNVEVFEFENYKRFMAGKRDYKYKNTSEYIYYLKKIR